MKSMKEQGEAIINEKLNFPGMFTRKAHSEFYRSSTVVWYALRLILEKKKVEADLRTL